MPHTPNLEHLMQDLGSISNELEEFGRQVDRGEPVAPSRTLRSRMGSVIKNRLYRFLWWQQRQIKALTDLTIRLGRDERDSVRAILQLLSKLNDDVERLQGASKTVPESFRRLTQQLQEAHYMMLENRQQTRDAQAQVERCARELHDIRQSLLASDVRMAEHAQVLSSAGQQLQQRVEQVASRLSELGLFTHQTRTMLSLQDRRLGLFIEEARKRLPEPFDREQVEHFAQEEAGKYDALYLAFEDLFRGTRQDIKARQSIYLPILAKANVGCSQTPILDLGCGRGEWLDLLREKELHGVGVDQNVTMTDACASIGLDVRRADALSFLTAQPDCSFGAVTSFHMVEHMPFETVLTLVDEALRVLKPGGVLILETPNPANLLVGAQTFYLDPTHVKPLPSPMLRFFVEARGFCDVQVLDLSPYPEAVRFPSDGTVVTDRLNDYFYGPQDYSVVGRKP